MSFSQANQFEQHVNNQLSKWLGATPVLLPIFRRLGIAQAVNKYCSGREEISHGSVIEIMGLNRLMAPKPMYKFKGWLSETVLEDTLDVSAEQMHDTRLGRTLDDIHPHLEAIWQDIAVQAILEYEIDLRYLHYDITSVYFEGEYEDVDMVNYGYSRDHRPDAKQVNLAVNVTGKAGVPLGYRVLAGRTSDRTTPLENLKALRSLLDRPELAERKQDFLLVSDRAMLDREVLVAYEEKSIRWLGPLNADEALLDLIRSVPDEELDQNALDYRPTNQPKDEPLRYQGVLRSATIDHDGQRIPVRILVVKSRTKVKLDRDRRETYLKRLTDRLEKIQSMLNTRLHLVTDRKSTSWQSSQELS